jgi:transcriptional regulator with XRE-family HTH domain
MTENTLKRIKQYLDLKGIKISVFEREIGMSNGSFASQLRNNKTIGVDKLEKILRTYTGVNIEWLLTGKGNMLKVDVLNETPAPYNKTDKENPEETINYKELAESRKETIDTLKKLIEYLEAQLAEAEQNKK